ncbi:hypothetical protein F4779DRAFT_623624 [Xylariaceae sp. FL0662B]|nr:hypothetical protein F4779DRAFT_623624 [Xylariaceae sp. FL0662B]
MTEHEPDPDFRSIVDAAAASWMSQRTISPEHSQSESSSSIQELGKPGIKTNDATGGPATEAPSIRSDITAWETSIKSLPEELRFDTAPLHPLAQALADQPTIRPVEWNQYRHQGGFVPRTAHDYSSLMIYVSGQVNPNPCRNCLLRNGPYARCIVAPPSVLAQSSLKHACANCTYQNQYKKCTNAPIGDDEMARRATVKVKNPIPRNLITRKPKSNTGEKGHKSDHAHRIRKPTAQGISADSFAGKLNLVRGWSPRSRRRMKAEAMQWQAAIMTIEAESTRTLPPASSKGHAPAPPSLPMPMPPGPQRRTTSSTAMFAAPPPVEESMEPEEYGEEYGRDHMNDESESEDREYEGTSWAGFDDMGPVLKPPR